MLWLFSLYFHFAISPLFNSLLQLATTVDKKTGLLPIQVATENEHSHFIVHNLLKRDMPIDMKEKVRAQLVPHHYSWNHIVANTDDLYHQVVTKILQSCTQPQVLALAHVEGPRMRLPQRVVWTKTPFPRIGSGHGNSVCDAK